jgi:hypothetical protein
MSQGDHCSQGEPLAPPNGHSLKELRRHLPRTIKLWLELDQGTAKQPAACCVWHEKITAAPAVHTLSVLQQFT